MSALNLPGAHAVHGCPFKPENPLLHIQSMIDVLADTEVEFDGHSEQGAEPMDALNVETSHGRHNPPFGPLYPALQLQFESAKLIGADVESSGQFRHSDLASIEYLPGTHAVQLDAPGEEAILPGSH
jgi:hypothetical protein